MFAQFILDCFPSDVSQYGLIGCGFFSVLAVAIAGWLATFAWLAVVTVRESLAEARRDCAAYNRRHGIGQ
jgi:hypothetical protein